MKFKIGPLKFLMGIDPGTTMPNQLHDQYAAPSPALFHAKDRSYGWHPSTRPSPHARYTMPAYHAAGHLPASVDLTPECPPVYDQGTARQLHRQRAGRPVPVPADEARPPLVRPLAADDLLGRAGDRRHQGPGRRRQRRRRPHLPPDQGRLPRVDLAVRPDPVRRDPPRRSPWAQATAHKIADPVTIDNTNLDEIKSCLASGYPVAFGFVAYPDLESEKVATTGKLPLPAKGEQSIGGHEVLMVGYDDATQLFKVRNSWGPGWGLNGYFLMPYAYATNPNLASDFRSAKLAS